MREHLIDKYFAYRRRYVDFFIAEAPQRALLAVLSEAARLSFVAAASALCAAILWTLTVGALVLPSHPSRWTLVFAALAVVASLATALALGGALAALRDRTRVATNVRRRLDASVEERANSDAN